MHREHRSVARRRLGDGVDEGRPCFRVVIDHLAVECPLPGLLVRPLGIADEAAVAVAVEARAVAAVDPGDMLGAAAPGLAELRLLARMDPPPIDCDEHE